MSPETSAKIEKTIRNMLEAFNERDLELTLSNFYFDENFLTYGLDGTKTTNREETRLHLEWDFNKFPDRVLEMVWCKTSVYRTMATFAAECLLRSKDSEDISPLQVRLTAVLREINDRWKVNQLYFSAHALTQAA